MPCQTARLFTMLLCTILSADIYAQVVTIPTELNPGDKYRLAFVTRDMTPALSSDIATYDAFVTAQADEIADLVNLETTWRVIGSTPTISAKFHTGTDNTPPGINGVPIYRLDGALIATDYDDLWDGSLQNPLQIAQDGSLVVSWGSWTGTRTFGRAIPGDELGAADLTVVDGALAASVFHSGNIAIHDLKRYLAGSGVDVRPPDTGEKL